MLRASVIAAILLATGSIARAQDDFDDFEDMPVEAAQPAPEERAAESAAPRPGLSDRGEGFGDFEVELRLFARDPLNPDQPHRSSIAFAFRPGYVFHLTDRTTARGSALVRLDEHDGERSDVDLREAIIEAQAGAAGFRIGVNKVFWGVTESRHLVDIVNQVDYAEDIDGDERFGQLMAMASYEHRRLGLVDLFAMTWFRPQRFPGSLGRPGTPIPVADDPVYESDLERWHVDLAARWSTRLGPVNGSLSYFYGTAREPELVPVLLDTEMGLQPRYDLIHQAGLELQWITADWIWKLESIARQGQGPRFAAATAGLEKTFGIAGDADVTLFAEYNYDGRESATFTILDRDLFLAGRLALNDTGGTEVTLGTTVDVVSGDTAIAAELNRRLSGDLKLTLEARAFRATDRDDPLYWFRRDHYAQVAIRYFY